VSEPKTDQGKAKSSKQAAVRTERSERRRREAEDELNRRRTQLHEAKRVLHTLEEDLRASRDNSAVRSTLAHHLIGFYDEVDKLAKGKSMIEATTLIVDGINDIIRDAKAIVEGDPFLDRVKEFVPAGENPVYPDVLMVARSVQTALERAKEKLDEREKHLSKLCRVGRTIVAALDLKVAENDHPSSDDVQAVLDSKPVESWFFETEDGEFYFDFDRLDRVGVQKALATQD
jgi:hypothetical protein